MIISSQFLAIVDATSTKNKKNSRSTSSKKAKKFRKHLEVCYLSVPHWEEKNGNYPCANGLICRPPSKSKAAKGKPIPHKCFKDNKKNRVAGNIHFASKKERMNEDNYLFSISYKDSRIIGREEEEGDIAKLGDDCAKPIKDYKVRTCVAGSSCRVKDADKNKKGVTSYCLADVKAKEGETCSRPIRDFKKRDCEDGLDCRPTEAHLASGISGVSSACRKILTPVKEGEVCRGMQTYRPCVAGLVCKDKPKSTDGGKVMKINSIPTQTCQRDNSGKIVVGQPAKEDEVCSAQTGVSRSCAAGLVCREKDQPGNIYLSGQPFYCQKPRKPVEENGLCQMRYERQTEKCKAGLVCRDRDGTLGETGHSSYCLKPHKPVGEGEECWPGMKNYREKDCKAGLTCKTKPYKRNTISEIKKYCLKENSSIAKANEICSKPTPEFKTKTCPEGYKCRIRDQDVSGNGTRLTGVASYCIRKAKGVKEGQVCYQPTPNFQRLTCNQGLECRNTDDDIRLGKTGVSSFCLKKRSNEIQIAGEGQDCAKAVPGYVSRQCSAGLFCAPKKGDEQLKGVTQICQKSTVNSSSSSTTTTTTTRIVNGVVVSDNSVRRDSGELKIGSKCQSGGSPCPSGHTCKNAFKSYGSELKHFYCLLPSAFDSAGYSPFVGVNNYCSNKKPCTAGAKCLKVYDGTSVCIASRYSYRGDPMRRRR